MRQVSGIIVRRISQVIGRNDASLDRYGVERSSDLAVVGLFVRETPEPSTSTLSRALGATSLAP